MRTVPANASRYGLDSLINTLPSDDKGWSSGSLRPLTLEQTGPPCLQLLRLFHLCNPHPPEGLSTLLTDERGEKRVCNRDCIALSGAAATGPRRINAYTGGLDERAGRHGGQIATAWVYWPRTDTPRYAVTYAPRRADSRHDLWICESLGTYIWVDISRGMSHADVGPQVDGLQHSMFANRGSAEGRTRATTCPISEP